MVSLTRKTQRRRELRKRNLGKANKRIRRKGTPKFPVHPEQEE